MLNHVTKLAKLSLDFGRVNRATFHPDGVTPESDTDHTVMLALVAIDVYDMLMLWHENLDIGRVVIYANIHDLVEVYAGDEETLTIDGTRREAKHLREAQALARLRSELGPDSFISQALAKYEAQEDPESRFVRVLDKVLPKVTHTLNGCVAAQRLTSQAGFEEAHKRQIEILRKEYPEPWLDPVFGLLQVAGWAAEAAWPRE